MSAVLLRHMDLIGEPGSQVALHRHDWGQVLWPSQGCLSVQTALGHWLIPPTRGLWVPAHHLHALTVHQRAYLRFFYLAPELAHTLAAESRVLQVSSLLLELLIQAAKRAPLANTGAEQRLCAVLVDELSAAMVDRVELPMPIDARALAAARRMQQEARAAEPLEVLLKDVGASRRTLERCFRKETGLGLSEWRQRFVMHRAAAMLLERRSVGVVAGELGYRSTSAFAAAFRAFHGKSPRHFV